jgi:hypothetical protein
MYRGLRLALFFAGAAVLWKPLHADNVTPAKYDLYSWKDGNEWDYSLLPVSKQHEMLAEIKHVGGPLRGPGKIKEKLLAMKEGDKISWRARAENGLVYPPKPVMEDIRDYAKTVGVKLSIADR